MGSWQAFLRREHTVESLLNGSHCTESESYCSTDTQRLNRAKVLARMLHAATASPEPRFAEIVAGGNIEKTSDDKPLPEPSRKRSAHDGAGHRSWSKLEKTLAEQPL